MADAKLETEVEEDLHIVETDTLPAPGALAQPAAAEEKDDDDEEDEDDARLADSEDDADEEVESGARKKRLKRRAAQKQAKERTIRENEELRRHTAQLEARLAAVEKNALGHNETLLDQRLSEAQREIRQADAVIAKAIEAGNGEDVTQALAFRDRAKEEAARLEAAKTRLSEVRTAPPPSNGIDPRAAALGKQWMEANPWFDPQEGDDDSAVAAAIDRRLVREGYRPDTMDYWEELTSRVKKRLGGATSQREGDDPPAKRKTPPPMGGGQREHVPPSTRREVHVTPERRKAMEDNGSWDDPVKRQKILKAYAEYDRNRPT